MPLLYWTAMFVTAATLSANEFPAREIPAGANSRERFLKLIDRPRCPLNVRLAPPTVANGISETRFLFDSEAGLQVPGLLVSAVGMTGKAPVVIVLHGTGGSKAAMRPVLHQLAARGLHSVAIDGRFSGERSGGAPGSEAYQNAIYQAWKTGHGLPLFYDTAYDTLRLVDYLETREDIDATRIGAIGYSKGGIELYLAAAADQRLYASVPCIGVQSFGWALDHNAWQSRVGTFHSAVERAAQDAGVTTIDAAFVRRFYDRVAPGIAAEFDGENMLPLIAPRPLLVINGARDDRTPLAGLKPVVAATQTAYEQSDANEKFEFLLQPDTSHRVTDDAQHDAIDWLASQLRDSGKEP